VLRGGAFNNESRNVRVCVRNDNHPHNEWNRNGFRVCAAHDFREATYAAECQQCVLLKGKRRGEKRRGLIPVLLFKDPKGF